MAAGGQRDEVGEEMVEEDDKGGGGGGGGDSYKTNVDYRHYYYIYYFTVSHKFELKTHHRYLPAATVFTVWTTGNGGAAGGCGGGCPSGPPPTISSSFHPV